MRMLHRVHRFEVQAFGISLERWEWRVYTKGVRAVRVGVNDYLYQRTVFDAIQTYRSALELGFRFDR
jgi:hypothetical protein